MIRLLKPIHKEIYGSVLLVVVTALLIAISVATWTDAAMRGVL